MDFPNLLLTDIGNPSQHSFLPIQELCANFWTYGSLASTSVSASGLSDLLLFSVYPGMWTLAISYTLSLPFCLSIFYFLTWEFCAPIQELKGASYIFWLGSVWVNPGLGSIWRPSSSHICSVMSYLPIYMGKSWRLAWGFMLLWFLKAFSQPGSCLTGVCVLHGGWQRGGHTYSPAETSVQVLSGCPRKASSFLVPWMGPSLPGLAFRVREPIRWLFLGHSGFAVLTLSL